MGIEWSPLPCKEKPGPFQALAQERMGRSGSAIHIEGTTRTGAVIRWAIYASRALVVRDVQSLAGDLAASGPQSLREAAQLLIHRLPLPSDPLAHAICRQLIVRVVELVGRLPGSAHDGLCPRCGWLIASDWQVFLQGASDFITNDCGRLIPADKQLVERARQAISDRLREHITVDLLAKQLGCHRRTLERAFRTVSGDSVHSTILRRRTQEAIRLLRCTDLKVEAVAVEVGFRSRTSLRVAVRRATGQTPGQLRRSALTSNTLGTNPLLFHHVA
jgi:AraC-like DNA-binding protein